MQRWYGIDAEFYNQLPTFPWYQIFNMTGAPLTVVQSTGVAAKKKAEWAVDEQKRVLARRIESRRDTSASSLSTAGSATSAATSDLFSTCD